MKNLFCILLVFVLYSCQTEVKIDLSKGNLWEIKSRTGVKSYIFGTIHLYPKSAYELPKSVLQKLESSNILALERDITNSKEQQKFTDFEMPQFLIQSYNAIVSKYGNELISMENILIENAKENNITIQGLESTSEIRDILNSVKPTAFYSNEEIVSDYQESLLQYKQEEILDYKKSLTKQLGLKNTSLIVDKRNQNWINNIESLIHKDRVFIAVGMGHLGGNNGLLKLLSEKGYQLKPISLK